MKLFLFYFTVGIALSILFAWPVMVLWNDALVPAIDGIHEISWIQAWEIQLLALVMFRTSISSRG